MRLISVAMSVGLLLWAGGGLAAESPFAGRWNLTGTGEHQNHVYWLEITEKGEALEGKFLHRGGSPVPLPHVAVEDGELIFRLAGRGEQPGTEFRARVENGQLVGRAKYPDRTVEWTGVRPPSWPAADANARHTYGSPVALFNGTSLENWELQHKNRPSGWSVVDGAMTNAPKANNLISRQKFKDFKLEAEYKLEKDSNSGIYLRGRYELQVLDDAGKPPESHGHMAIYAWTPPRVNASKAPGEWQTLEATLVGNRLSATLNGQQVHDNAVIEAITGGALDADEDAPGPIMIQGDHGRISIRKLVVTPITTAGAGTGDSGTPEAKRSPAATPSPASTPPIAAKTSASGQPPSKAQTSAPKQTPTAKQKTPPKQAQASKGGQSAAAAKALEQYTFTCQPCHGPEGKGVIPGTDLSSGNWKHGSSLAAIAKTISEGVPGTAMLPAKDRFSKAEIQELAKLVRSFDKSKSGKKPPVKK